jgi:membrane protein YqaA with SNARE-associated domain
MTLLAAGQTQLLPSAIAAIGIFAATPSHHGNHLLHILFSLGFVGVFLVSIVDSSFVPLPVPGVTDIMLILFAAQKANVFLLVFLATLGSALGGFFSYQVGQSGGMAFLEKHVPKRIFKRVCDWMESHAILAVALPAILPPPMPLSPFVLAAGALKMSRRKFMTAFTISRCVRHTIAAWLGIAYGPQVLALWGRLSAKWATPILIVLWTSILVGVGVAFWKIYHTSKSVRSSSRNEATPATS